MSKEKKKRVFRVSPSAFKAFYDAGFCPLAYLHQYVTKEHRTKSEPGSVLDQGTLFEHLVYTPDEPEPVQLPRSNAAAYKNKPYEEKAMLKPEKNIRRLAEYARRHDQELNAETLKLQHRFEDDTESGVLDRLVQMDDTTGRRTYLEDMKFTGASIDKYDFWGQPVDRIFNRKFITGYMQGFIDAADLMERREYIQKLTYVELCMFQAVHYIIHAYREWGEWLPFVFRVYGMPTDAYPDGWAKVLKVEADHRIVSNHQQVIELYQQDFIEQSERGFDPYPKYRNCLKCPYNGKHPELTEFICEDATEWPDIEIVDLTKPYQQFNYGK